MHEVCELFFLGEHIAATVNTFSTCAVLTVRDCGEEVLRSECNLLLLPTTDPKNLPTSPLILHSVEKRLNKIPVAFPHEDICM